MKAVQTISASPPAKRLKALAKLALGLHGPVCGGTATWTATRVVWEYTRVRGWPTEKERKQREKNLAPGP